MCGRYILKATAQELFDDQCKSGEKDSGLKIQLKCQSLYIFPLRING